MKYKTTAEVIDLVLRRLGDSEFNPASSRALARVLSTSHTQASRIRRGESPLDLPSFLRAMRYLDLAPGEFVRLRHSFHVEHLGQEMADWLEERERLWVPGVKP